MSHPLSPLLLLILIQSTMPAMELAGDWQARPYRGDWPARVLPELSADTSGAQTVLIPNAGWSHPDHEVDEDRLLEAAGVIITRTVSISDPQSSRVPVLRWESLRWSHRVFVDGELVGGRDHYAPGQMALPRLDPGDHQLSLVLANLRSLPKSESGQFLIPVGGGNKSWGSKQSCVGGEIDLRFVAWERIDRVLMIPDPAAQQVTVQIDTSLIDTTSATGPRQVHIHITDPSGATVVDAVHEVSGDDGRRSFTHAIPEPRLWHPHTPQTYAVTVTLRDESGIRDHYQTPFGMRTFRMHDGDFLLNGRYHPILGTNVVADWLHGSKWFHDIDGKLTRFYIDSAQGMNANTLRTHTLPPNHRVADICDTGGTMLLAEMPLTYNGADYDFTVQEEQHYRDAAMAMQEAWVTSLGNHPSIIMWVPINEPTMANVRGLRDWQEQEMEPALRELDPTREVLQAADLSQTIADVHNYSGFWGGAEGDFHERLLIHARNARVGGVDRALFNTEYIEGFWGKRRYRWAGPDPSFEETWRIYAHIGQEQTDAMRILRYDGILPYWLAAWNWTPNEGAHRPWAPTMMYAALRSSLARTTAAIDLFDRNYQPETLLSVPVVLINDEAHTQQIRCELHLVADNPGFDPHWKGFTDATRIASTRATLSSRERRTWRVPVTLPEQGEHYLAAVIHTDDTATAVSQRIIRIVSPHVPQSLIGKRIRVLGADASVIDNLQELGLDVVGSLPSGSLEADLVVVWTDAELDSHARTFRRWANAWLTAGGRMLFLAQRTWDAGGFAHLPTDYRSEHSYTWTTEEDRSGAVHEVDPAILGELSPRTLLRWNGRNGVVSDRSLMASWLPSGGPATVTLSGPILSSMDQLLIPGSAIVEHDLRMDLPWQGREPRPTARVPLAYTEGNSFLLLRTEDLPDTETAYHVHLQVETDRPHAGRLWLFGMGGLHTAGLRWRVDGGPWQEGPGERPIAPVRMGFERIWFGWMDLGAIELPSGSHRLELQISGSEELEKEAITLGVDCLLISPDPTGTIHARSGSENPVIARHAAGDGSFVVSQLAFSQRLFPDSPAYDPAALQLFLQLLDWTLTGESGTAAAE